MATSLDQIADVTTAEPSTWRLALRRLGVPGVELFSAGALFGWAWLLLFATPPLFERAPGYQAMAAIAHETVWGILLACIATAQVAAVATREPVMRLIGCGGAASAWAFVAIMLSQVNGVKTGGTTYGLLALFLLWRNLCRDK